MMLQNLRIRTRLALGFLTVLTLLGCAALAGVWKLSDLGALIDQLVTDHAAKLVNAQDWEKHIAVNLVRTRTSLLLDDARVAEGLAREIKATSAVITETQKKVEASATSVQDKRDLAAIAELLARYRDHRDGLLKRKAEGDDVRAELAASLEPMAQAYLGRSRSSDAHGSRRRPARSGDESSTPSMRSSRGSRLPPPPRSSPARSWSWPGAGGASHRRGRLTSSVPRARDEIEMMRGVRTCRRACADRLEGESPGRSPRRRRSPPATETLLAPRAGLEPGRDRSLHRGDDRHRDRTPQREPASGSRPRPNRPQSGRSDKSKVMAASRLSRKIGTSSA